MSEIHEVADAVTAKINDAAFAKGPDGQPLFTAVRTYAARASLARVDRPLVFVVPRADGLSVADRDGLEEDLVVMVVVLQKIDGDVDSADAAANELLDPLMTLCRQVARVYEPSDEAADAQFAESLYAPLYDPQRLEAERVFVGIVHFTFKQFP